MRLLGKIYCRALCVALGGGPIQAAHAAKRRASRFTALLALTQVQIALQGALKLAPLPRPCVGPQPASSSRRPVQPY